MKKYSEMTDEELIAELGDICAQIGWVIAIPVTKGTVPGLVLGNEEFINTISEPLHTALSEHYDLEYSDDDKEPFETYTMNKVTTKDPKKNGGTFH